MLPSSYGFVKAKLAFNAPFCFPRPLGYFDANIIRVSDGHTELSNIMVCPQTNDRVYYGYGST